MASIPIHSDLYNFKKTYKGFTPRQIKSAALAVAVLVAVLLLLWHVLEFDFTISLIVGVVFAAVPLSCGMFPLFDEFFGLPAEEAFERIQQFASRGNAVSWRGESCEPLKGETTREYKKRVRAPGAECRRKAR